MIIKIEGTIGWEVTASSFSHELAKATGDVEIHINSGGGSVFEGVSIYNEIKAYDKGTVTVVITAFAASMASYIALAGDKIKVYDNATYMIHNPWVMAIGDYVELKKQSDICYGLAKILAKSYTSKTAKTTKEVQTLMDAESWFYGQEIVDAGFADEVITSGDDKTKAEAFAFGSQVMMDIKSKIKENAEDSDKIAALLNTELPKPFKEGVQNEVDDENRLKVNALKIRLKLKGKNNG